jgi:hypothetical protein
LKITNTELEGLQVFIIENNKIAQRERERERGTDRQTENERPVNTTLKDNQKYSVYKFILLAVEVLVDIISVCEFPFNLNMR